MSKLTKDQWQKIVLSLLFMMFLVYCFNVYLIGPLNKQDAGARAALAAIDGKLAASSGRIKRLRALEEQAKTSSDVIAEVNTLLPEGEPIAWFPPRIKAFFDRQGIKDSVTRLDRKDKPPDPDLAGYDYFVWTVDLPAISIIPLGIALAGLENEEPLLEINHIQITAQPDKPEEQRVTMTIGTLVR